MLCLLALKDNMCHTLFKWHFAGQEDPLFLLCVWLREMCSKYYKVLIWKLFLFVFNNFSYKKIYFILETANGSLLLPLLSVPDVASLGWSHAMSSGCFGVNPTVLASPISCGLHWGLVFTFTAPLNGLSGPYWHKSQPATHCLAPAASWNVPWIHNP